MSCICTDQSVNYKGLEERGHACGQAVRLAVGVTLGLAQLLCDPGQVVYQFLSHAAIKWQFRAPPCFLTISQVYFHCKHWATDVFYYS